MLTKGEALEIMTVVTIILLSIILFFAVTIIGPGERGILINGGAVSGIKTEGIYFFVPIYQGISKIDIKTQKHEVNVIAYSKDLQTVTSRVALNYSVKADTVDRLYQEIGMDYQSRIIDPAIQEALKAVTARYTAQELIEERNKVKEDAKTSLFGKLDGRFLRVDEFSIVNFDFSDTYEQAVEAKQRAQQEALKAENDLKRVKFEADQRVAQAEAEAKAIQIQAQAITQQGGAEYVNLKAVEKWNGNLPTQMIPGGALPFINLNR